MKSIFEYSHVKLVSCLIIRDQKTGDIVGKIICNWSDNPNGSVCTAQVFLDEFEKYGLKAPKQVPYSKTATMLDGMTRQKPLIGKAGGYGYDKLSTAIYDAMGDLFKDSPNFAGRGLSVVQDYFDKTLELELIQVL